MADRMHSYSMFPPNLTSSSLQQSQIPRQPPQSQQPDPQMIPALSNPEHGRMWQQMNQLPNAYRPQQSGDLAASQMNHQMQDFSRGQALSHGQGQPIVQQIQQSFGLNAQRMNPPVFHDPQASQPQSIIPPGFSTVPMNTQQQMKLPFNMNTMMHGLNNPGVSRHLKMLPQDVTRLQPSGLGTQHAPNQPSAVDMFVSPALQPSQDQMHGSPRHAAQPVGPPGPSLGMVPGNPQQNAAKKMMTPVEFHERRVYLRALISHSENALLQTRNSNSADPHVQQKILQLRTELAARQEMYSKFVATSGAMVTQQIANGIPPSNMPHMNPMGHSTSQPPQQATAPNTQVQPGFVTQTNQSITAQYGIPSSNGSSPLPTQGQSALNQQIPIQPTQIGRPNNIPPRTGGTPHQISGGQLPNTMSPNLGNFTAQGGQKAPNQMRPSARIMPLDKERFDSTYTLFCRSQNMNPVLRVAIGENRMVDLHQLHVYVMQEDGAQSVTLRDMWAVIGGRLGFIQFPGKDTEPARSGPGIAQQLHNTYEQYLQHFENAYVMTVQNRSVTQPSQQPMHLMNSNPLAIGNNTTPGVSGNPSEVSSNPPNSYFNRQVIAAARYAHMSVQDMRAQRVPESLITFVESRRHDLQRVYQQQLQLIAKRNAEQEQQNMANAQTQLPNTHEQLPVGLPLQRPIGANTAVNVPPGDAKMANGSFVQENAAAAPHKPSPTQDQIQQVMFTIGQIKQVFQQRLSGMPPLQIPEEQRMEYSQLLEQVYKMTTELDSKLHMYFVVLKSEDALRRFIAIALTVARQRQLLSTAPPQYIINLTTLRNMQTQILRLNEEFENRWRAMKASSVNIAANFPQHAPLASTAARLNPTSSLTVPPVQNTPQIALPATQTNGRPVSINPSPQPPQPSPSYSQLQPPPQSHSQLNQPQLHSQQTQPNKRPFTSSIPPSPSVPPAPVSLASSTPPPAAASSATPATSAPTPQTAAGSPQTPKSPAAKAAAKTKTTNRANRKLSTAGKGSATPETVPSVVGVKRAPEEDVATLTSVAPSEAEASNAPSPKKVKTEWEGETSEALVKKQQELDNIKTEEDATVFFDRMKELFAMSASTDEEIHHDIASTLDQILAGVAQEPADAAATAAALSIRGAGDAGPPPTALSPHMGPANDAFLEFIDFSSFTTLEDEDNDSKAPTPDLDPSSETNPSPESGSEGDSLGNTGSPDKTKFEEASDRSDPLRLGPFKEIDGGESACYQVDSWKWEGSMHTLDQPWAIFNS